MSEKLSGWGLLCVSRDSSPILSPADLAIVWHLPTVYREGLNLRIVLDRYSTEIFVNDEQAMYLTFYTPHSADGISFQRLGKALISVEVSLAERFINNENTDSQHLDSHPECWLSANSGNVLANQRMPRFPG